MMITWDFHEHLFFILVYFSLAHESGFFWVGTEAGKTLGVKEEKLGKGWKKESSVHGSRESSESHEVAFAPFLELKVKRKKLCLFLIFIQKKKKRRVQENGQFPKFQFVPCPSLPASP